METFDRHGWVIALLKQAGRPAAEITQASLEENLHWLVQMAIPEASASAALRQRVQALSAIRGFWRHWWPRRGPSAVAPVRTSLPLIERAVGAPRGTGFSAGEQRLLSLLLAADVQRLPEDPRLQEEMRAVGRQLLERLPEPEREALVLEVLHGLSLAGIAQVLGQSEARISALLEQARATIFRHGRVPFDA
jgi:RNA polymerase sigma factor (sigma-70 family)